MRYIGSKTNLLENISEAIFKRNDTYESFCDIFSGTGVVGRRFKKDFEVISNDLLYFSYVIQRASIGLNTAPEFHLLKKTIGCNPLEYLLKLEPDNFNFHSPAFIFENYSPNKLANRQYLTPQNALKIDLIRQCIEQWKTAKLIDEDEYFYLLACLIEAVPFISNIAGTYGAYLKHWDKRSHKKIFFTEPEIFDNKRNNCCFNANANELILKISGDILYMDPPYNSRQYVSNYHLLETIAKYDCPQIKGVTGIREDADASSNYCKIRMVRKEFEHLVKNANFKLLVLSYSTEGIMAEDEIVSVFESHCDKKTLQIKRIPYRRYKRTSEPSTHNLNELLFSIKK